MGEIEEMQECYDAEIQRMVEWVNDLQAGMYINCVYCGHRYGPDDEVDASMQDALKEHVEQCPKHPMSAMRAALQKIAAGPPNTMLRNDLDLAKARRRIVERTQKIASEALAGEGVRDG